MDKEKLRRPVVVPPALAARTPHAQTGAQPQKQDASQHARVLALQRSIGNRALQRLVEQTSVGPRGGQAGHSVEGEINQARGGGRSLDAQTGAHMGQVLGSDFNGVKLHTDAQADRLSRAVNARAFTVGSDIFFRADAYRPHSTGGQKLLAHELTHVAQQGGKRNRVQTKLSVGPASDRYEQEAERVSSSFNKDSAGTKVRRGMHAAHGTTLPLSRSAAPGGRIQRAVGYEWEVGNWDLLKLNSKLTSAQKKGQANVPNTQAESGEVGSDTDVITGKDFKMKGDTASDGTNHIEFVTDPPGFQESKSGKKKLDTSMKDMKKLGDNMISKGKKSNLKGPDGTKGWLHSGDFSGGMNGVLIRSRPTMVAEPQVTAGIRLDRLAGMLQKMGGKKITEESDELKDARMGGRQILFGKQLRDADVVGEGPTDVIAKYKKFVKAFGKNAKEEPPASLSLSAVGLIAMIRSYLIFASRPVAYPKSMAAIMARTDFGSMFEMLPEAEYFHNDFKFWGNLCLYVSDMLGSWDEPLFSGTSSYVSAEDWQKIQAALKRGQWLSSIVEGREKDLLTNANFPDESMKTHIFGMGGLGEKTDVVGQNTEGGADNRVNAPIFEFRRMQGKVSHHVWPTIAAELFKYFWELNDKKQSTFSGAQSYEEGIFAPNPKKKKKK